MHTATPVAVSDLVLLSPTCIFCVFNISIFDLSWNPILVVTCTFGCSGREWSRQQSRFGLPYRFFEPPYGAEQDRCLSWFAHRMGQLASESRWACRTANWSDNLGRAACRTFPRRAKLHDP